MFQTGRVLPGRSKAMEQCVSARRNTATLSRGKCRLAVDMSLMCLLRYVIQHYYAFNVYSSIIQRMVVVTRVYDLRAFVEFSTVVSTFVEF